MVELIAVMIITAVISAYFVVSYKDEVRQAFTQEGIDSVYQAVMDVDKYQRDNNGAMPTSMSFHNSWTSNAIYRLCWKYNYPAAGNYRIEANVTTNNTDKVESSCATIRLDDTQLNHTCSTLSVTAGCSQGDAS